jgi:hypothetical protein
MTRVTRRETFGLLLGVSGILVGCASAQLLGPKLPDLPEDCVWVELPYSFVCLHGTPYKNGSPDALQETAKRIERSARLADLDEWDLSPQSQSLVPQ